ncbi:Serine/threonine protein kinase PrkC, regulator of stationary phase [Labilithrix luteola]|uniref:Serine/threonine protein kinase PrkC, regulator of stationary phase n=1 Tax=Labilithrix luteola TaxID=1391654 RepID=A0A0K1Q527_9BACT|nr:serine/threonine-protein kinase [Labilithrix luteola]AKV00941.1 Serine/threonine protein kinase PrkC, regulator of stationary phase [Labilithrix luteola]
MDSDVERLVREQRLVAAAQLASERGDASTASALYERACDFERAAAEAVKAEEWARALPLALEGRVTLIAEQALPMLLGDPAQAERVAYHLERRGDHLWSARLLEGLGQREAAARAYERAGEAIKAAALLEAKGDVVGAARTLEAQSRREPGNSKVLVALGGLLLRYGKTDAAVRALQKVAPDAPERREALTLLLTGLDRLGLARARLEAEQELATLGGKADAVELAPRMAEVRTRLFGRYDVVREVASSPSARVLECTDAVRSERVAVKIFAGYDTRGAGRDALARFEREVRVLGTLEHPNIVPLRDYVADGPALVLGWMGRGTLEQMLSREPLAPARAVEIAEAVLSALGEAHRIGIVHRDVKPANVLFDDAGVTRLGDFGVAHLADLSTTATAGVIGTLEYMSPEQREGRPATVQSDIYGVGAILWEMLTGERPEAGLGAKTLRVRPSALHRDLDRRHDQVVLAMLSRDPSGRPLDAFAARHALRALEWPSAIEPAAMPRSERPKRLRPVASRLQADPNGALVDEWLGRHVVTTDLDATSLARASAFARADHPALQAILRVDRESKTIWLAAPRGHKLAGKLSPRQASILTEALARLHDVGEVHGSVDPDHVYVDEVGNPTLTVTMASGPTATADLDRLGLSRLS